MNETEHTRGPIRCQMQVPGPVYRVYPLADGAGYETATIAEADDTRRLIEAAYTSYDKHCGSRAIECAEADLLGELVEACRAAAAVDPRPCRYDHHGNCQTHHLGNPCEQALLRAVLAKCEKGE